MGLGTPLSNRYGCFSFSCSAEGNLGIGKAGGEQRQTAAHPWTFFRNCNKTYVIKSVTNEALSHVGLNLSFLLPRNSFCSSISGSLQYLYSQRVSRMSYRQVSSSSSYQNTSNLLFFFPSYNPSQYLEASSGFPSEHYSSTRNDRISLLALEKHSLATGKSLSHTWRKSTTTNSRVIVIENVIISGNLMPRGMRWWWCSSPWQPKPQEKQTLNFLAWIN